MENAKATTQAAFRAMQELRNDGWKFKHYRQGIVVRSPKGRTQIYYGVHEVDFALIDCIQIK